MSDRKLSPKEQQLLEQLDELFVLCREVTQKLSDAERNLKDRDRALSELRKEVTLLKEENQHQKEVIQTWRQRIASTLSSLN